jgi:heavy metal translocating P-type ATPase
MSLLVGTRRLLLPVVATAVFAGGVAMWAGADHLASALWGAVTVGVTAVLVRVTVSKLRQGRVAVDVVAVLALAASLALGELLAGAIVAVMVATGDALEQHAQQRARRELSALLSLAPTVAHRVTADVVDDIGVDAVVAGDVLLVRPGEVVPVDGAVLDRAVLDESVLTGEARPVERDVGEAVCSGTVNAGPAFGMSATTRSADSAYAGIVRLVRAAGVGRAPLVRLADRYALVFVPVVLGVAALAWVASGDAVRALAVLVVATPCPLVLAAPVAIVSGISSAARAGAVIKDGAALEALGRAGTVLLDKTGTITAGNARLVGIAVAPGWRPDDVLRLAASVEQGSPHVLARAVVAEALARGQALVVPGGVTETHGTGVGGDVDGHQVWVGAAAAGHTETEAPWLAAAQRRAIRESCSIVVVDVDGAPAAALLLTDEVRTDTPRALRALRRAGVHRIVMLSGDHLDVAAPIGRSLGVDEVYADRTPEEKVAVVRAEADRDHGTTVMVGDGVNDAPALAAADVGVAMGARGATASSEAADVVLVVDRLDGLATAVEVARRARTIAGQSVLLGMGLSFAAMGVAAIGLLPPVAGAVTQEVIDVLAIANALRALRRPSRAPAARPVPTLWSEHLGRGHGPLRLVLEDLRRTADALDDASPGDALAALQHVSGRVRDEIVTHEQVDEADVYPPIVERLGGADPLAAMSRAHQEIFHLASLLDRLVEAAAADRLEEADRSEARRILYALDAILRLHFAQEEELLASLSTG